MPTRDAPPGWDLDKMLTTPYRKRLPCHETFTFASGSFGTTSVMEKGQETWHVECEEPV